MHLTFVKYGIFRYSIYNDSHGASPDQCNYIAKIDLGVHLSVLTIIHNSIKDVSEENGENNYSTCVFVV